MKFWYAFHMLLTLSCDRASFFLSKSQEVSLTRSEQIALRLHLGLCRSCRRYRRQLLHLREILRRATTQSWTGSDPRPKGSPEQKERVMSYLRKHLL